MGEREEGSLFGKKASAIKGDVDEFGVAVGVSIKHPVVVGLFGLVLRFGVSCFESVHYLWLN